MEASIYLDVVFIAQLGMNTLLLWMTKRFLSLQAKNWRILLGGLVSSLLHCTWIFISQSLESGLLFSLLLLLVGIEIAFFPRSIRMVAKCIAASLLASFLLGGGLQIALMRTQMLSHFGDGMVVRQNFMPWHYLIWAIIVSYLLLKCLGKHVEGYISKRHTYCSIYIRKDERVVCLRGLIDTGNQLTKDGKGAVIVSTDRVLSLFEKDTRISLLCGDTQGLEPLPYASLGNAEGVIWGFIAQECRICVEDKIWRHENVYIGMNSEGFSGGYDAIVPSGLLEEELG